jgi:hypothetical protein
MRMPELHDLLERRASGYEPAHDLFERVLDRRDRRQRNQRVAAGVLGIAVFAVAAIGLVRLLGSEGTPADESKSPFLGTWVSTDFDGSTQTMTVRTAGETAVEIVVHDDGSMGGPLGGTVCSGAPLTITGIGRVQGITELVMPSPVLTCDDGSAPEFDDIEERLRNLTFVHHPESDALTDSFDDVVWERENGAGTVSGGMWPQSSVEQARRAQRLADEGDPRYTWQVLPDVFPLQRGQMDPRAVEFFTRFLEEELGWEEFRWGDALGSYAGVVNDWPWEFVVVRCAPGRMNPLYPDDPEGRECAPTLDEHRYETVKISAGQPTVPYWEAPNGPSGIWVVTRWAMVQPADAPITDTHDFFQRQVQQVVPPSAAEATALLEDFLQARVDGDGAEGYLHTPGDAQIPLLYATSSGAPYERSEFELVQGPVWPGGWMEYKVRLFAGDGTVVEQPFLVGPGEDGRLGLEYGTLEDEEFPTTENGAPVPEPYTQPPSPFTHRFDSPFNGFSVGYPSGWRTRAATEPWGQGEVTFDAPGADVIFDPTLGEDVYLAVVSQPLGAMSNTEWVYDIDLSSVGICTGGGGGGGNGTFHGWDAWFESCGEPHGASGDVVIVATATRGYIIYSYVAGDRLEATHRHLLKSMVKTVELRPEDAVEVSNTSASP